MATCLYVAPRQPCWACVAPAMAEARSAHSKSLFKLKRCPVNPSASSCMEISFPGLGNKEVSPGQLSKTTHPQGTNGRGLNSHASDCRVHSLSQRLPGAAPCQGLLRSNQCLSRELAALLQVACEVPAVCSAHTPLLAPGRES